MRAFFDWIEANAAALAACELDALDWAIRRCAELHLQPHRPGRRPLRARQRPPARLRALGRAQAREPQPPRGPPRRGGGHGHAARQPLQPGDGLARRRRTSSGSTGCWGRVGLPRWDDRLLLARGEREGASGWRSSRACDDFREHLGGELTVTLLRGIGRALDVHEMNEAKLVQALEWMRAHRRPTRHEARPRRGAPHLLHQHPPGRDLGPRSARNIETHVTGGQAARLPGPALRRRPAAGRRRRPGLAQPGDARGLPRPPRPRRGSTSSPSTPSPTAPFTAPWSRRRSTAPTGSSPSACATAISSPACSTSCLPPGG